MIKLTRNVRGIKVTFTEDQLEKEMKNNLKDHPWMSKRQARLASLDHFRIRKIRERRRKRK